MGRPKANIDVEVVKAMASVGATNTDIADYIGVSDVTIRNRFFDVLLKCRADRRNKLREMQWQAAQKGNTAMLIWLGKQELGQSEKVEQKGEQTILIKEKSFDTSPKTDERVIGSTTPTIGTN
jgi:hypothetical protein